MGMREFVRRLERENELIRIQAPVSTKLEITEIADRISKQNGGGKALLFENAGTDFPVLINSLGSARRMELAFKDQSPDAITDRVMSILQKLSEEPAGLRGKLGKIPRLSSLAGIIPRKKRGKGACQEAVQASPDLGALPILTCWPHDGGPFITLPLVHTVDPNTGLRNLGMYRMQVMGPDRTGMHWQLHKTGARHFQAYKKMGKRMPVAVALGGDPVYSYCATAPLPDGVDEYLLAGIIRKRPVRLVKCLTQELWVPEDADFILEGYVDPDEEPVIEGPFGDHTGFYSLEDHYPIFHITAITHRRKAIYPATIVGIPPQEDAWLAWATEKLFLPALKMSMLPEISDLHMPTPGVAHNLALLQISSGYPGHARKVMNAVWGAGQMMFTKICLILDHALDIRNYSAVLKELSDRVDPGRDIQMSYGPLDVLDHASRRPFEGGKLGVDVTGSQLETVLRKPFPASSPGAMALRNNNPEIVRMNLKWAQEGYGWAFISLTKNRPGLCQEIASEIRLSEDLNLIRCWIFFDSEVELNDPYQLVWLVGSHTDMQTDAWVQRVDHPVPHGILFLDATRKTQKWDGFERAWPNPVIMNTDTMDRVDARWQEYHLGDFIPSPSKHFEALDTGDGACVRN